MTTDEKVVWEAVNKDLEKGFKLLMARYGKPVYWHVRRLVVAHEDAQDATQEAFIRIFRSMGQFNADNSLTAWIYRIATNEALRLLEQHKADGVPLDEAGTAAWNWYAITQFILGIKPGYEGLEIDPCIPADWKGYRIRRRYRGAEYDIRIANPAGVCRGVKSLTVDGVAVEGNVVPQHKDGTHTVEVILG